MTKILMLTTFLIPLSTFAANEQYSEQYSCSADAEFCQSSEKVYIQTQNLESVCDELYRSSAADLVVNITCYNSSGAEALTQDRCD